MSPASAGAMVRLHERLEPILKGEPLEVVVAVLAYASGFVSERCDTHETGEWRRLAKCHRHLGQTDGRDKRNSE